MLRLLPSRRTRLALGLVLLMAVAPACSKSNSKKGGSTTTRPVVYPLTGLPPTDPSTLSRGAMSVKIDNIAAARPQSGIENADLVYEELAEGGLTRFIVVFQSTDAAEIGPVRSARPTDAEYCAWLNGALIYSGGAPAILQLVEHTAGIKAVNIDSTPGGSYRTRDRSSPHNLYTSTQRLYDTVGQGLSAPPAFNDFLNPGQPFAAAGAVPATKLTLKPGAAVDAAFDWDAAANGWKRSTDGRPHTTKGGGQLTPNNVIVQFTPYREWPADSKVKVADATDTGEAWILTGGMVVKGRWERAQPGEATVYRDTAGQPIRLPPGRTFVELAPLGSPANVV